MSQVVETGSLRQTREEVNLEWRIPDFYLSDNVNFKSPIFYFCNSSWCMILYPNGVKEPSDFVEVVLERKDSNGPKTLSMSLGIKKIDGSEERGMVDCKVPNKTDVTVMGPFRFISKLNLMQRRTLMVPSDVLTIICTFSTVDSHSPEVSLYKRLWNLSQNLRTMLEEKKGADFDLKVGGCDFSAHRMILESRCDYFVGMQDNELQENGKGAAEIGDIEKDVFQCILTYLYTGEVEGLSSENVGKTYTAADRLLLLELKKFCVDYMKENLSHELIFDAISIVEKYEEPELAELTMEYYVRNSDEILESEAAENLTVEHTDMLRNFVDKIVDKCSETFKNVYL